MTRTLTLEVVWSTIGEQHPDLPDVLIEIREGPQYIREYTFEGFFTPYPEPLVVLTDGVLRHQEHALEALLHEAAHALAHVRGIEEMSRRWRHQYHNKHFRALAWEVGLEVGERDIYDGFNETFLTELTMNKYAAELDLLEKAFGEVA